MVFHCGKIVIIYVYWLGNDSSIHCPDQLNINHGVVIVKQISYKFFVSASQQC